MLGKIVVSFIVLSFILLISINIVSACEDGQRRLCGTDVGVCKHGISICKNGTWSECEGAKMPTSYKDICGNHLDDNCDGEVDEDCFPWVSLVLIGFGLLFISIGLYYMQKEKTSKDRIFSEGLGKD